MPKKWLKSAKKRRKVSKGQDFIVTVLLSAHAERVGVSRMRDFYNGEWLHSNNNGKTKKKGSKIKWYKV